MLCMIYLKKDKIDIKPNRSLVYDYMNYSNME